MALIDFHGLISLYKLACSDAGTISNRSHPPPMPVPIPIRLPSPSVEGFQYRSAQLRFFTPQPDPGRAIRSAPNITPTSRGTSVRQKQELNTDRVGKYDSNDYKEFIVQDFERHRVFVDVDDFMRQVLHVPDDWKTQWGPAIKEVKLNKKFHVCNLRYSNQCETRGIREDTLYKPLVDLINAILEVTCKSTLESVKPKTPQRYIRNDPKKLHYGVLDEADLAPDIIALHEDLYSKLERGEIEEGRLTTSFMTWANPLQVLEVKHIDTALVDGSHMPRLETNGTSATLFSLCFVNDERC